MRIALATIETTESFGSTAGKVYVGYEDLQTAFDTRKRSRCF